MNLPDLAKKFVKMAFGYAGLELRRSDPLSSGIGRLKRLLELYEIDTVLDIGANVGQWAKSLRSASYEGDIISFEPIPEAHAMLSRRAGGDRRWIVAPPMAIGERDGEVLLNIAANSLSSSLLEMLPRHREAAPDSLTTGQIKVQLRTLDSLIGNVINDSDQRIFCKIDAQGYEMQVLRGGRILLPRIAGFQMELSLVTLYAGSMLYMEMISELKRLGFELFDIYPAFTDPNNGRVLQVDGVFFRSEGYFRT